MQEYLLSDIKIGLKHSFEAEIDESRMQKFLEISGDNNPMHIDADYAKSKGMIDRVVYGMLTSSFYSTLVGVYLPGKYALLHSIEVQFTKPVFIGDKLIVKGEVSSVNEMFNQIEVKAYILNQNSEKISRAKIKIGLVNE
ncbi:acyl dehydratase [Flavobacterium sp. 7E]|uniref:MaoC/PaaZ C-terminal domain-containing protein n=1 Tax=Flavobacterium sp. 7E TaxID=2735898 RepID=UPI00156FE15A|nr:MaoC/PaaZ C-terminal domain-containing protein [Flavobacterium sp. 7E]NRS90167.1 acyl dehydratase [Flavobacterium sp. 7E]